MTPPGIRRASATSLPPRYRVVLADTPQARRMHFRVRFHHYCTLHGLEAPERFPDGQERDSYDARAAHFLLQRRSAHGAGTWLGTLRMIFAGAQDPERPMERICKRPEAASGAASVEVSRLTLPETRLPPHELGLYLLARAAADHGRTHGVEDYLFLVRPGLWRLLNRRGMPARQIGPPSYHRGWRIPCRLTAAGAQAGLQRWSAAHGIPTRPALAAQGALVRFSELPADERAARLPHELPPSASAPARREPSGPLIDPWPGPMPPATPEP